MVRIEIEEYIHENGRIVPNASVYAEETIRRRLEYLSKGYSKNGYEIKTHCYPDYLLLTPIPTHTTNDDVRLDDDVKDAIISLVERAIEDVRSLKHLEIILDI